MTYGYETFVGRKYGMWHRASAAFDRPEHAEAAIATMRTAEHLAHATPMTRRIVQGAPQ